jgi:hypothetical protein
MKPPLATIIRSRQINLNAHELGSITLTLTESLQLPLAFITIHTAATAFFHLFFAINHTLLAEFM